MSPFIRIKQVMTYGGKIDDDITQVIVEEEISPRMLIDIKYAIGPLYSSALIIWAEDREWRGPKSEPVEEEIQPEPPKPTEEEILRGKVCEMKEKGWTVSEISKRFGLPPGTVINMCKDDPEVEETVEHMLFQAAEEEREAHVQKIMSGEAIFYGDDNPMISMLSEGVKEVKDIEEKSDEI